MTVPMDRLDEAMIRLRLALEAEEKRRNTPPMWAQNPARSKRPRKSTRRIK